MFYCSGAESAHFSSGAWPDASRGPKPGLSAADERRLAEQIAAGDQDARNELVEANLALVIKIAQEFEGRGMLREDLIGEGNLGLIRAAELFDPAVGARFTSYAAPWIRQTIKQALTQTAPTIRVPGHVAKLLVHWRAAERRLKRAHDAAPSFDEVATALGLGKIQRKVVAKALQAGKIRIGSEWPRSGTGTEDWMIDEQSGPEEAVEAIDDESSIDETLSILNERERAILIWRFGLAGEPPLSNELIAERMGITRQWVRVVGNRALRKLERRARSGFASPFDRTGPRGGERTSTPLPACERPDRPAPPRATVDAARGPTPARSARRHGGFDSRAKPSARRTGRR
jgi:RNA polymerase primary sigma factor